MQNTGLTNVHLSITSVELVRGAVAQVHCMPTQALDEKALWKAYRACYRDEPFVRIVRERGGIHRLPEPKLLSGTNLADVGFDIDPDTGRIVSICAIDNLMKGAAGSVVQCLNLMSGFDERTSLDMIGLHPL
jgi:N-acetyl-gamma-glutamyl-phosphate/LysW-gamma-L-alpha-aminoadipyl-6-phosphate reductase